MSEEKTEQLILKVEKKTILFDKFRHDYRKEKSPCGIPLFIYEPVNSELKLAVLNFLRIFSLNCS